MPDYQNILDFWFEGLNDDETIKKDDPRVKKWFVKNPAFDKTIKKKFEGALQKARNGDLRKWEETPEGQLALIILLDQFPRNIYRNTPESFAFDGAALDLTVRSIEEGSDRKLDLIQRVFVYLPLEHSEDILKQELSVQMFEEIVEYSKSKCPQNTPYFEYNLEYAHKHREIIAKFGRFPHRNSVLQRPSTDEEEEYLKQPGSGF